MSSNKRIRTKMEKIYGRKCMIEEMGIRYIPSETRRNIIGYKKWQDQIQYHHIRMKSKGGQATLENGSLLKGYNHQWLHKQPKEVQERINNMLQQYKLSFVTLSGEEQEIVFGEESGTIDLELGDDFIEIPLLPQTKKQKYNRAKVKREYQKIIDENLEYDERD